MINSKSSNASLIYRSSISLFLAIAVILFLPALTSAASLFWKVATGNWSTASNWGGKEPTSSDNAYINNGGTALITQSGETCSYLYLGAQTSDSGIALINGGSLSVNTYIYVGSYGSGTLNITNGGKVSNSGCNLGYSSGSTGTATVDGKGSTWTNGNGLWIGNSGNGTLNITNSGKVSNTYGYVGYNSGSTGAATVDGTGSTWTNGSELFIGISGNGTLNITNGGKVSNSYGYLGYNSGSTGAATVDGTGSTWTNISEIYIGRLGNGTLNITNGSSVSSGGYTYVGSNPGSTGTINFGTSGGTLTTKTLFAPSSGLTGTGTINTKGLVSDVELLFDTSHGLSQTIVLNSLPDQNITLNLDMTGTSITDRDIGAGYKGNGSLIIRDALIVNSNSGYLGYHADSIGTATVDGTGSTWTNSSNLYIGYSGNGTLNITNGGKVSNYYGYLGYNIGSTGTASVNGTGSTWTNSSELYIGRSGNGTLNITNGGIVSNSSYGYLGYNSGSTGTATVDGKGSTWTNFGRLLIGNSGNGTLNITNGGNVSNSNGYLASIIGSTGTATVDGTGSTWTNRGSLVIGNYGNGTLNITNGGNVSNVYDCSLGLSNGSTGTATVDGPGSTWTTGGNLYIGYSGTGSITQLGGTNSVSGNVYLGYGSSGKGTYNLNGGTLILKALAKGSGTAAFNFGRGTLQASGNFSTSLPMTLTGEGGNATINTAGYNATLAGTLSGIGGLNKIGAGVLTLSASDTYTGPTTISNGTLKLASYGTIASTSIIDVQMNGIFDVSAKNASGGFNLGASQTLKGSGKVLGNISALAGSHIAPGDSAGVLNVAGNLSLTDGACLDFELGDVFASDKISMPASTLFLNGQDFADFNFTQLDGFGMGMYTLIDAGTISGLLGSNLSGNIGSYSASLAISGNDLVLNVVPEPSCLAMLITAVLGLGVYCNRRKR